MLGVQQSNTFLEEEREGIPGRGNNVSKGPET